MLSGAGGGAPSIFASSLFPDYPASTLSAAPPKSSLSSPPGRLSAQVAEALLCEVGAASFRGGSPGLSPSASTAVPPASPSPAAALPPGGPGPGPAAAGPEGSPPAAPAAAAGAPAAAEADAACSVSAPPPNEGASPARRDGVPGNVDLRRQLCDQNVFVFHLPSSWTEQTLRREFSVYGEVMSAKVVKRPDGSSKGYGFVCYFDRGSAVKAVQGLNGRMSEGKRLKVSLKKTPEECLHLQVKKLMELSNTNRPYDRDRDCTLFVFHIPSQWENAELRHHFESFGTLVSAKIAKKDNASRGYGFVTYENPRAAALAIANMNGVEVAPSKRLKVQLKQQNAPPAHPRPGSTIFVFHIPNMWEDSHLRQHFNHYGKILTATIQRDALGNSRGYGFLSFESRHSAANAVLGMNGFCVGHKRLKVSLKRGDERFGPANNALTRPRFPSHDGASGGPATDYYPQFAQNAGGNAAGNANAAAAAVAAAGRDHSPSDRRNDNFEKSFFALNRPGSGGSALSQAGGGGGGGFGSAAAADDGCPVFAGVRRIAANGSNSQRESRANAPLLGAAGFSRTREAAGPAGGAAAIGSAAAAAGGAAAEFLAAATAQAGYGGRQPSDGLACPGAGGGPDFWASCGPAPPPEAPSLYLMQQAAAQQAAARQRRAPQYRAGPECFPSRDRADGPAGGRGDGRLACAPAPAFPPVALPPFAAGLDAAGRGGFAGLPAPGAFFAAPGHGLAATGNGLPGGARRGGDGAFYMPPAAAAVARPVVPPGAGGGVFDAAAEADAARRQLALLSAAGAFDY